MEREEKKFIIVYGEIVQETNNAILLKFDDDDEGVWLPKSQIEYCGEVGDVVEVYIPEWLADEKCLSGGDGFACPQQDDEDAEPGASTVPGDTNWLGQETITVSEQLTTTEKSEYAEEMAALDKEIEELEDERDKISKSLKKQIDAKENERRDLSKIVREGQATREVFCDKVADYNTLEIVWTDAMPPHEEVSRRKMTEEERQPPLIMHAKPEAELVDDTEIEEPEEVLEGEEVAQEELPELLPIEPEEESADLAEAV